MRWLRSFLAGVLGLGLLWAGWSFRSGNAGVIDLDLIWIRLPNVEVWRALALAVAAGASLGGTLFGFAWIRQRILNRRQRKAIERLEHEVERLRSLPPPPVATGALGAPASGRSWLARLGVRRRGDAS